MEKLIIIEQYTDSDEKSCLKVSITTKGAEVLRELNDNDRSLDLEQLWDNIPDKDGQKRLFSSTGMLIYSTVFIPQDKEAMSINEYSCKEVFKSSITEQWLQDPKKEFLYYPRPYNVEKMKTVVAKLSANHWAIYSDEKLYKASREPNDRFNVLATGNEKILQAMQSFNYDNYKQDDKYYNSLKDVSTEIEKEMDYCQEKMSLVAMICKGMYQSEEKVSTLYKKHRGVEAEEATGKMNVTVVNEEESKRGLTEYTFDYEPLELKGLTVFSFSEEKARIELGSELLRHCLEKQIEHEYQPEKVILTHSEVAKYVTEKDIQAKEAGSPANS